MSGDKAIIVAVKNKQNYEYFDDSLEELKSLLSFAGAELKFTVIQKSHNFNPSTLIGKGKIDEIKNLADHLEANMIVFLNHLTPTQFKNLEREFENYKVIDRVGLILDIFAQRARSIEGKLQVELAQLNYLLPRIVGYGRMLSRLGGGIGTRGPGEKKLTIEKRKILKRINYIKNKIKEVEKNRTIQRKNRIKSNYPLVSIVGYTNAGKSTLFNLLTKSNVMVDSRAFTTLDPKTELAYIDQNIKILLTDTVGFVRDLPKELLNAFKATFEELIYSDLHILIFDISNVNFNIHINETQRLLDEIGASFIPQIKVFNKIDKVHTEYLQKIQQKYPDFLFISAKEKINIDSLKQAIKDKLNSIG
ncbi:MAG: GTPase HflX [Candidatus Calescibacterium sp.]|nr:GTPase HflX [Candidatus Calescibacterium sp.]MCX7972639.1 GTPase HflX [bacterium]MDW8194764.1 GTPase HflX [Candidatus Calescibacterium sp.]